MLEEFLKRIAYGGHPRETVEVVGHIADTDVGQIEAVRTSNSKEHSILKTIKLSDQNLYAMTDGLSRKTKTLRGTHMRHVKFIHNEKRECKKWAAVYRYKHLRLAKICYLKKDIQHDGATVAYLGNEYINEALIGTLVSRLNVPHFVKTQDAWIEDGYGHILMEYGGHPLTRSLLDLSYFQFRSVIMQTLLTILIGQRSLHLKHHDIHLDNVFVSQVQSQMHNNKALAEFPIWSYKVDETTTLYVRHHGVLAKLGDFGLASATEPLSKTRFERVDYPQLDAGDPEWGAWNGNLAGQRSYDVVTFLTKFFLEEEEGMCRAGHAEYAQRLFAILREINESVHHVDITASSIGRPMRDAEGNTSPLLFLKHPFFAEFQVKPEEPILEII